MLNSGLEQIFRNTCILCTGICLWC